MMYEKNGLFYFSFESLNSAGVLNRIFTRHGGVSPSPWNTLNLGGMNGDSRENVVENRKRIFDSIGRPVTSIFDVWQVHGNHAICAMQPRSLNNGHEHADIILTNLSEITLFMRFADCVPVFLYDPKNRVVGLVHAGWQGTMNKAVAMAVNKMRDCYASNPADIMAAIGPSIGPDHYEVGTDVVERTRSAFVQDAEAVLVWREGKYFLDLWRANELTLRRAGVEKIEISQICTACHTEDWFSHRAENGATGRFAALIALS